MKTTGYVSASNWNPTGKLWSLHFNQTQKIVLSATLSTPLLYGYQPVSFILKRCVSKVALKGKIFFLMKFKAKNPAFEIFYLDLWGVYVL